MGSVGVLCRCLCRPTVPTTLPGLANLGFRSCPKLPPPCVATSRPHVRAPGPGVQAAGFPPSPCGLESSTVSQGSPFWPGRADRIARGRRSGFPKGSDWRRSHTEWPVWPGTAGNLARSRPSGRPRGCGSNTDGRSCKRARGWNMTQEVRHTATVPEPFKPLGFFGPRGGLSLRKHSSFDQLGVRAGQPEVAHRKKCRTFRTEPPAFDPEGCCNCYGCKSAC